MSLSNPFSVTTPEAMSAEEIVKLFVQSAPNLQLSAPGHLFINGHRGSGKSMALRLLAPDCQMIAQNKTLSDLPFMAIYTTVKATELDIHEFSRLRNESAGLILAEHLLVTFFAGKTTRSLLEIATGAFSDVSSFEQLKAFCIRYITEPLVGYDLDANIELAKSSVDAGQLLLNVGELLDTVHINTVRYLRRRGVTDRYVPYAGPLLGFQDFLFPLLCNLRKILSLPQGPVYLLIDDADNLNYLQTQVLNTWVSYRTSKEVSLKISTQLRYKTYSTTNGNRIEKPHDYTEVDAFSMFTGGNNDSYYLWVKAIVERRIKAYGAGDSTAEQYFPPDANQERAIGAIAQSYKDKWSSQGKGARPGDDAYRYARPDYIRNLGGSSKGSHTYSYSGMGQLVHISSGIIRHFLDAASRMYAKQLSKVLAGPEPHVIASIDPAIQDEVVRGLADEVVESDFDKLFAETTSSFSGSPERSRPDDLIRLRTLIKTLGGIFYETLVSERSERRVMTFALSNVISDRVESVIQLGVENGYFYESYVGAKDGRSRTRRYVLTRRAAPYFKLDPTGFSGYLFVTNEFLELAIADPSRAIEHFRTRLRSDDSAKQGTLFGEITHVN